MGFGLWVEVSESSVEGSRLRVKGLEFVVES